MMAVHRNARASRLSVYREPSPAREPEPVRGCLDCRFRIGSGDPTLWRCGADRGRFVEFVNINAGDCHMWERRTPKTRRSLLRWLWDTVLAWRPKIVEES